MEVLLHSKSYFKAREWREFDRIYIITYSTAIVTVVCPLADMRATRNPTVCKLSLLDHVHTKIFKLTIEVKNLLTVES